MADIKELPLTDNCKIVLKFLQDNDKSWVGSDLQDAINEAIEAGKIEAANLVKGIHPVCNSLVKRGLVQKGSEEREFTNKKGETGVKEYVTYSLTDDGRDYIA